jgi:hypothetical protein
MVLYPGCRNWGVDFTGNAVNMQGRLCACPLSIKREMWKNLFHQINWTGGEDG